MKGKTKEELIRELSALRQCMAELEELIHDNQNHIGEALRESEQNYAALVEDAPVMINRFLPTGEIIFTNKVHSAYLNMTPEQMIGINIFSFVPNEEREEVRSNLLSLTVDAPTKIEIHRIVKPNGDVRWQRWTNRAVFNEMGEVIFYQSVGEDITERKKMEEEVAKTEKLSALGILAGGIAHDFNNLLTSLYGNIELAQTLLPAKHEAHGYLESAIYSMDVATRLTNQLLTFARGGAPIKETISLQELITKTTQFVLSGSNVRADIHVDPALWLVHADKGQLGQVISNLVINANQAMPSGGVITITVQNVQEQEERQIKIVIQDQGIGIPTQNLQKIFDPYFTTKQTGSGLGLASSYNIINKHGGHMMVESQVNEGTTFTIYLPAKTTPTETAPRKNFGGKNGSQISTAHVLLLDDEMLVCNVLTAIFSKMGHQVTFCVKGLEAIAKYKEASEKGMPYDLTIIDLTIPGGMGGEEVAQEILKINPQAKIIVSSGYANDPILVHYEDHGFVGRIVKPYKYTQLQETVQKVLQKTD